MSTRESQSVAAAVRALVVPQEMPGLVERVVPAVLAALGSGD